MKPEEAVAIVRSCLLKPDDEDIRFDPNKDGFILKADFIEAVRALLDGFETITATLRAICEHCGYETGSKECKNVWCAIREWRGPEPSMRLNLRQHAEDRYLCCGACVGFDPESGRCDRKSSPFTGMRVDPYQFCAYHSDNGPEPGGSTKPPDNYIGEQPVAYGAPFDEPVGEA